MKTILFKTLSLFIVILTFVACKNETTPTQEEVIDIDKIKTEIQNKENEFAEIFNSGQIKSIGYYADDAVSFSQNHQALIGKQAIVEYYISNIDTNGNKISFTTNEVFVFDKGERVLEIGYFKVVNLNDSLINSGNYMSLFEKRNGQYYSLRDMSVTDIPIE